MSEEVLKPPSAEAVERGYDVGDVKVGVVALFGLATIVALVIVIFAVEAYYDHVREQQVYQKVLVPVSEQLRDLRAREDLQLHSYKYIDRNNGSVRLPIERAMELFQQEAAADKLFYPAKPTPVAQPQDAAAQPAAPARPAEARSVNAPPQK